MSAEAKISSVLPNNSIKEVMPRKPESTVYVEPSNNKSSMEDISYVNDVSLGFSSTNYGSQNIFRFPRTYQFLSNVVMELKVDGTSRIKSDYIAYAAIKEVTYTVGGTELCRMTGETVFNVSIDQCETLEKREAMLNAAGRRNFSTSGVSSKLDEQTTVVYGANNRYVYANIPLPWSSLSCDKLKPFPLHLLSEPLEVQIIFRTQSEIDDVANAGFSEANLLFKYGKLGNINQMKNSVYRYPFYKYESRSFTLSNSATEVDLTGFRKGEIVELMFYFVPTAGGFGDNKGIEDNRYFDGIDVDNLLLKYNGQKIWSMENRQRKIWSLIDGVSHGRRYNKRRAIIVNSADNVPVLGVCSTMHTEVEGLIDHRGGSNSATSERVNGRYVYYKVPISEMDSVKAKHGHFLGADFSKQQITLSFDTPKARTVTGTTARAAIATRLFVTYVYRAMYQLDGESALLIT